MKKILIILPLIVLLIWLSDYSFEREKKTRQEKFDTIATTTYNKYTDSKDSVYYVVNYMNDTVDWWGYSNGIPTSKKQMELIKRQVDSMAYHLGYTPYIGYTLMNPRFFEYYGRTN